MYCLNCGSKIEEDNKYCLQCGNENNFNFSSELNNSSKKTLKGKKILEYKKVLSKIIIFIKKNYKIFLIIFLVILAFYWWELRSSHIKSECGEISYLRAKALGLKNDTETDLFSIYFDQSKKPTYKGLNRFLKDRYNNYYDLKHQTYNKEDYEWDYDRCLKEYGL